MDRINVLLLLAKYNLKIVFGGKFIWFVLIAILFFCFLLFQSAYHGQAPSEAYIYGQMLFPGMLLIFYPTVFGLQNDEESKMLEILFGIPNYMYKVWMVRLLFVYVECFFILILMAILADFLLYPISIIEMVGHVMFPILFIGSLSFYLSTVVKGGNATAVSVIVITSILFMIGASFDTTMWNISINPYRDINSIHPTVWADIFMNNRLLLTIGSFGLTLLSLMNLQKREKLL